MPRALLEAKKDYAAVLVDSLDFWLYLCIQEQRETDLTQALFDILKAWKGPELILVSCEIGFSPLPGSCEARTFLKRLGRLNQAVAALAHEAHLVVAGLPLVLKKAEHGDPQAD